MFRMPMKTILIVDGHNVLHKLERYRQLKNQKFQLAADRLVVDLVNLSGSGDFEIIVVFDGGRATTESEVGDVKVIYSGESKSADSIIEKLVFKIAWNVADAENPIELMRIIRSYDPCMACSVHLIVPGRSLLEFRVC